jgi:hypothetical protein
VNQRATKSRESGLKAMIFSSALIALLFGLLWNTSLQANSPQPAASGEAQTYVQLELTTVEISAEGRSRLGVQTDAYPDVLTDLQAAALAHKVMLKVFAFPAFVASDGTPAFLHLPHNAKLTRADGTMTLGSDMKMTPHLMLGGRVLLDFALQTQQLETGNIVDIERIDLERVLHENRSQWIGECRQADGSDRLTYVEAHRIYAQAGEAVPVKTQLLLLDHPSPFQSDDPNSDWTAARQTIRVTFIFTDTDVKAQMAHPSFGHGNSPYITMPPSLTAIIEDGENAVVSQSVPGTRSGDRVGVDIHVLTHLKANQTVQSAFSIKEYEADSKHPGADGSAPTIVHTIATTRTLQSGAFASLGDYTTQDGINHEIAVQVEIIPLKLSISASRHHSPPFRLTPSGAVTR